MELLEQDEAYLKDKGYDFSLASEGENGCLIIKGYRLAVGKYDRDVIELLLCIPKGYNDAKLDNFYVDPPVRLQVTGQYPDRADYFEDHAGKKWQRFSRHLPKWRPGIDTVQTFLPLVHLELQNKT
jgi:Prokaryotic E2 family E